MKANILYIQESDLTSEFHKELCKIGANGLPMYVVVQLRLSPKDAQPMLNNIVDIRKNKARKKIEAWSSICLKESQKLEMIILEDQLKAKDITFDFTGVSNLNVYSSKNYGKSFLSAIAKQVEGIETTLSYF